MFSNTEEEFLRELTELWSPVLCASGEAPKITTTLSGGRSKHILKLTGPGRAKLVHAQGTAQALWASLLQ